VGCYGLVWVGSVLVTAQRHSEIDTSRLYFSLLGLMFMFFQTHSHTGQQVETKLNWAAENVSNFSSLVRGILGCEDNLMEAILQPKKSKLNNLLGSEDHAFSKKPKKS